MALFVSLGGVGYAAATGAITSREIRDSTIRGKDVRNASLSGADVRNGRLDGRDIRNDSLGGGEIAESRLGRVPAAERARSADSATKAASAGRAASAGSVTAGGVSATALRSRSVTGSKLATTVVRSQSTTIAPGDTGLVTVSCAAGQQRLGGGGFWAASPVSAQLASQLRIVHSFPAVGAGDWAARGYNGSASAQDFEARVLCLSAG